MILNFIFSMMFLNSSMIFSFLSQSWFTLLTHFSHHCMMRIRCRQTSPTTIIIDTSTTTLYDEFRDTRFQTQNSEREKWWEFLFPNENHLRLNNIPFHTILQERNWETSNLIFSLLRFIFCFFFYFILIRDNLMHNI